MRLKILIASLANERFTQELSKLVERTGFDVATPKTRKDAQLLLYKEEYFSVVVDLDFDNYSAIGLVKYIRCNFPSIKILLRVSGLNALEKFDLTELDLIKAGVNEIVTLSDSLDTIVKMIESSHSMSEKINFFRKNISFEDGDEEKTLKAKESEFFSVPIDKFLAINFSVFDVYIKIGEEKFLKVIRKHEYYEVERIKKYREKGAKKLFFKNNDRISYIDYCNFIVLKFNDKSKGLRPLTILYDQIADQLEMELETKGMNPLTVQRSIETVSNIMNSVLKDDESYHFFQKLHELVAGELNHSYLVAILSASIAQTAGQNSKTTLDLLITAAMFHDVGKIEFSETVRNKRPGDMSPEELKVYKTHPAIGAEIISRCSKIHPSVAELIAHHHELGDGTGFPRELFRTSIHPSGVILIISNFLADQLIETNDSLPQIIESLLRDHKSYKKYSKEVLEAACKILINPVNFPK